MKINMNTIKLEINEKILEKFQTQENKSHITE